MGLEEDLTQFFGDFREFRGEMRASFDAQKDHITAVSKKADDIRKEMSEHKEDDGAHGLGSAEKKDSSSRGWISIIISAAALGVAVLMKAGATK